MHSNTSSQAPLHEASPRRLPDIPALLLLLFAIGVPSAAALAFARTFSQNPWQWLAIGLFYEFCIGIVGFLGKVWQKLENSLVERTASWIEIHISLLFSRSWRRYRTYLIHEHEIFDIKGLSTLPDRDLELEQVFVQLDVNPTPIHQASADPIKMPEILRDGPHTIWTYLGARTIHARHFVITGAPGSGKTTLLKHLALSLARHRKRGVQRLPILLFLRDHAAALQGKYDNTTDTFTYSLAEAVNTHIQRKWQQSLPLSWIDRKLARGKCLILLDGLDEVADAELRKLVVKWVQRQMLAYGQNRFILTSRPHGYRDNPLEGVWVLETRPFVPSQVAQFVQNWYLANEYKSWQKKDAGMQMRAREGAQNLLRRLYRTPALLALAVNPLLLTMIATVHRYRGSLPGSRVALYGEIFEVFLGKRRESFGLVQELSPAQMQQVLRPLAYYLMQQGKREIEQEEACQISAPYLLRVNTHVQPDDFLRMVHNSSGLLLERSPGMYGFAHKTFQEYLAAAHIKEQKLGQVLVVRVDNDWWHETIRLYCAQADATAIIQACLINNPPSAGALALALDCNEEKLTVEPAIKEQLDTLLEKGREDPDLERRHVIAEALLRRRLDGMVHLHDEVFVDTSYITCTEYQLFLDEMIKRGNYLAPDHWSTPTFPQGQGHIPLTGMRPSDVRVFCTWLNERESGIWHYRMPTMDEYQQIVKSLQDECKLERDTGYWIDNGQNFVWADGREDQHLDLNLPHKVAFDLDRDLGQASDLASVFTSAFTLAVVREFTPAIAPAVVREFAPTLAPAIARAIAPAIARELALAAARELAHFLDPDFDHANSHNLWNIILFAYALKSDLALINLNTIIGGHNLAQGNDVAETSVLTSANAHNLTGDLIIDLYDALISHRSAANSSILPLARALIYSRALDYILSLPASSPSRKWWRWRPWHKNSGQSSGEYRLSIRRSIHSAFTLYTDLLTLRQREMEGLFAPEGILLVKESKPDEPTIPLDFEGEQTIYLSPDDLLTSVLERLARIPAHRIILVVPQQTKLWGYTGWRLMHGRMSELGHELLVISSDRQVRAMATRAGLRVAERISITPLA